MATSSYNNESLFSYIIASLNSDGGDGSVLVLLKDRNPDEVAEAFSEHIRKSNLPYRIGGTNLFYGTYDNNELIAFGTAWKKDVDPREELINNRASGDGLSWPWRQWDTCIITW